ncbi:hypothetical protein Tco_0432550 [Tanacetum coccineum]
MRGYRYSSTYVVECGLDSWKIRIHRSPRHSSTNLNQQSTAKEIWDNVEMLCKDQDMDISTTPYVQIYTHLKAYEPHAKKTLKKQEQSTSIVDPLAYVAHTTTAPVLPSPSTSTVSPPTTSSGLPPTQGLHATCMVGHIVTEPVQRKAPEEKDMLLGSVKNPRERWTLSTSKISVLMEAKEKGHTGTTTKQVSKANHEDDMNSDVDEGPNAAVAFMALVIH